MMWDRVIEALLLELEADPTIVELFGDRIRMTGTGAAPSPKASLLEYMLIADSERETEAPCVIQFDAWAPTMDLVARAERRLRQMFNPALPMELEGVGPTWGQYVDGSMLASTDRDGFSGRATRFRFTPLREKYAPPLPSAP